MKEIKLLLFGLLVLIPNIVKAECSYEEKSRLQSLASNITFSYDYKEIKADSKFNNVIFSITIANMQSDLNIHDYKNNNIYYFNGKNELTINNYGPGQTIEFQIYANQGSCKGTYLLTDYITLPPYNKYYKDSICSDIPEYKLCNRWNLVNMSYNDFIKNVKSYKETNDKIEEVPEVDNKNEFVEKVITFLSKYSFYLFGGIIVICSGLMFYLSRKDDFDLK